VLASDRVDSAVESIFSILSRVLNPARHHQQRSVALQIAPSYDCVPAAFDPGMGLKWLLIVSGYPDVEVRWKPRPFQQGQSGKSLRKAGGPWHVSARHSDCPADAFLARGAVWTQPELVSLYEGAQPSKGEEPQTQPHQAEQARGSDEQKAFRLGQFPEFPDSLHFA
jgi:hypothetical protein